MIIVLNYWLPV